MGNITSLEGAEIVQIEVHNLCFRKDPMRCFFWIIPLGFVKKDRLYTN